MALISRITNASIYVGGVNLLGTAEEIECPQPKLKMIEHKGLGLYGSPKFPSGLEEMTAKIKWSSLYSQVLGVAFQPTAFTQMMIRADQYVLQSGSGIVSEGPVEARITVLFSEMPGFKVARHENSESPSAMTVYYYKLILNGQDQVEIDVLANIWKTQGVDMLAQFRANIGA